MGLLSCVAVLLAALAVTGCGTDEPDPLSRACLSGPDDVQRALEAAPGRVTLDGTPLSECVSQARSQSELQNVGAILTRAAEGLEQRGRTDPDAALQLGYLVGAARRGAPHMSSLQAELRRRLERSAAFERVPSRIDRALRRGLRAGEANG